MNTEHATPSSKIIALAIVVVAVVVASWLIKKGGEAQPPRENTAATAPTIKRVYSNEVDTDLDGLADWEEALWQYNPNNPDTDGDGITDDIERQEQQQNALTQQEELALLLDPTNKPGWDSLPYTEQVSQLLVTGYLSSKQDGLPLTESEAMEIVENLPTYNPPNRVPPKVYGVSDIQVSSASGETTLRTYGNAVGTILSVPEGETAPNELLVLVSFLQTSDSDVFLQNLADVISRYNDVISKLLEITTPASVAAEHLAIINALSLVQGDIRDFRSFTEDPFLALSVFTAYNKSTTARGEAFQELRNALSDAGIVFSETEPGQILMAATPL